MTPLAQIFTPLQTARAIVEHHGVLDLWLGGGRVVDPTAGDGVFLEALVEAAIARGLSPKKLPLDRVVGVERDPALAPRARERLRRFGLELPGAAWRVADLFDLDAPLEADALVGNPPWANYVDLPPDEQRHLRPRFVDEGLVPDRQRLLLGGARVDVAALVIAHVLRVHLRPGGRACFLAPLSLYLNEGAHETFRRGLAQGGFALRSVWDHRERPIFDGVAARYGLLAFESGAGPCWPVPWHVFEDGAWQTLAAQPVDGADGPLAVGAELDGARPTGPLAFARPRQGVNACGATDVFVFDRCVVDGERALVANPRVGEVALPRRYVFPLLGPRLFDDPAADPDRFVLVPHDPVSGRPLAPDAVAAEPLLAAYLHAHDARLRARRGELLRRHLRAGRPWAMLGVGPYAFAPYRVAWEAMGRSHFRPRIFGPSPLGPVQGNQAMHAFIPCATRVEAERCLAALDPARIEPLLRAHRMEGTRSWAQPGRIARLLGLRETEPAPPAATEAAGSASPRSS